MVHKRKREWPVTVFKYGLMTDSGVPDAWWKEHSAWCDTWNKLVETNNKFREEYQQIFDADQQIKDLKEETKELSSRIKELKKDFTLDLQDKFLKEKDIKATLKDKREELKTLKAEFKESAAGKIKEHKEKTAAAFKKIINESGLYWTHKAYLEESFWNAIKKAKKDGPKFKSKFKKDICLLHRYTGGGAELPVIFRSNKRVYIEPVDQDRIEAMRLCGDSQRRWKKEARTCVHAWMGGEEKIFSCILHRQIPEDVFVKEIKITGRRLKGIRDRIKWEMNITVDLPPDQAERRIANLKRGVLALELGWRRVENELRVGVNLDDTGKWREIYLPDKIVNSIQKSIELQQKKDDILNSLRELLKDTVDPRSGISKYFEAEKEMEEGDPKGLTSRLLLQYRRITGFINTSHLHTSGYRQWFYYNKAHELCRNYHTIIIKDMDLKALAQPKEDKKRGLEISKARELSQKYRALAAIGEFREILKKVAPKYGAKIEIAPGEFTSLKHFECGHTQTDLEPEERERLYIKCQKCKAFYDQDRNAASHILSWYLENLPSISTENRFSENNENDGMGMAESVSA